MNAAAGRVHAVFLKKQRGMPMERPADGTLHLRTGQGIEGDRNTHPMSPRQVLITRLEDLDDFGIAPGELRENIVLEGVPNEVFVPGAVLMASNATEIRLTFYCEPCKRIGHLIELYHAIIERRGILGVVLADGAIRSGDPVDIKPNVFPALSSVPYDRFLDFIGKIPPGKVVTYKDITIGMGVAESYARAVPGYIRRTADNYPVHRILDFEGTLTPYVLGQAAKLAAEGIRVEGALDMFDNSARSFVDVRRYAWLDDSLYRRG